MTTIAELMTTDPIVVPASEPISIAAKHMADADVGDVLVQRDGALCGIVTDRDLVVRAMAKGVDPNTVTVGEICTEDLTTVAPDDNANDAIESMRTDAIRRVPVVDDGVAVGVLSLGDLAERYATESLLGHISAAPADQP